VGGKMIRLENVRKEYDDLVAVSDLNVDISEGQVYGLIGPNGAGKTTTIRMACGLLEPTGGTVHVSGVDVHHEPERAQEFIGYLSDFFSLYEDLKVWEYLDYFAHAYKMPEARIRERIDEVIQQVGLEVKTDAMIKGLSRGMKQRLGIARAVIHEPKVLLLDEPASGLDPKARLDLRNLLRAMSEQGTTVLISSHILTELEGFCTSIGLMEKGLMVRSGTIQEITSTETEHRVLRLSWVGDSGAAIKARLEANPKISGIMLNQLEGIFRFTGPEEELPDVLRDLVEAGVRVISFAEVKQTVEDLYMKLSRNEVM
jgi:ABC-2 type transport system ATP-binding protein